MKQPYNAAGSLRILNLIVLAVVIGVVGFEMGRAGAAREALESRRTSTVDAIEHAAPAVVSISTEKRRSRRSVIQSGGSGVIVHPDGFVVTNSHVIRGGGTTHVELFNGGGRYRATVVADLPRNDLALLRIRRNRPFPYVSIARTKDVMLGETAIAVGNPRGLGDTITVGVVSAVDREALLSGGTRLDGLIQTDASINSGNSGGALLDLDGELMGVIVSLLPQSDGIAFAIPGDQVRALLRRALGSAPASKRLRRSAAAATPAPPRVASSVREEAATPGSASLPPPVVDQPPTRAASAPLRPADFGMRVRERGGRVEVVHVDRDGPAWRAGLLVGDVITRVNGRRIQGRAGMEHALAAAKSASSVKFSLERAGMQRSGSVRTP